MNLNTMTRGMREILPLPRVKAKPVRNSKNHHKEKAMTNEPTRRRFWGCRDYGADEEQHETETTGKDDRSVVESKSHRRQESDPRAEPVSEQQRRGLPDPATLTDEELQKFITEGGRRNTS